MFGHLNSTKFPKLLSKRMRKRYYKTLGTSVNNLYIIHSTYIFYNNNNNPSTIYNSYQLSVGNNNNAFRCHPGTSKGES